ncbi:MAG: exosortase K [Clostridiales bacterium]|mgnify:CR=1 FL=1|nr:exosortase K [Clostridiales bacterium]
MILKTHDLKKLILQNWFFYLLGLSAILGLKCFYRQADSGQLDWILAPTAAWVHLLSGITFVQEPKAGYINHDFRFLIAPSCSGVRFMTIVMAMLIFSFVHHRKTHKGKLLWTTLSIPAAYLFTVFVNGFRIVLSIWLPLLLQRTSLYGGWLTPERLHTMTGTVVYFTGLLLLYRLTGKLSGQSAFQRPLQNCIMPTFWYFTLVLVLPFLSRIYQRDLDGFAAYTLLMISVCMGILLLYFLLSLLFKN